MYANLGALKAAIQAETTRTDTPFVSRLAEFVKMAEKRLFVYANGLRVREMETRATLTFTAGVSATPADFLEARRLTWESSRPYSLSYRPPDEFYALRKNYTEAAIYTIDGTVIDVAGAATGTATLSYYAKPAALSADGDTNATLTAHGDCYLFAALIEAYAYLRNVAKTEESALRFRSAVEGANSGAVKARFSGATLAPRIPHTL